MTANATSPAASGPAGSHFEGQIGAHYLLSMLTGTEPRGLPGTTIDRVEFQRAAEGRPLDDVIVYAHDEQGDPAVLEIQVKRSITFAPADSIFRSVVDQIVEASQRPEFWSSRYELAIAIARTSHKIDGAYQDVVKWARDLGSAETFIARIERPGSANDDMRSFVRTFRSHLRDAGACDDDETVWRFLRKFQILVFDFTARGSASEALAKERAARALHPDEATRAGSLWASLVELALKVASSGGDRTRDRLIEDLRPHAYRLAGDRRFSTARAAIAEASRAALADIGDRVSGVMITRPECVAAVHAALDEGHYVEIRGDAGVGKSGVLKHFAEQLAAGSQVVVLSPGRTIPGGWATMRAVLGFDGTAREFLSDLASDGGAVLFIDGLDFFGNKERRTVVDLVREAANVPGFAVITTARRNFGVEDPNWLPADALGRLRSAPPVVIDELSAAEIGVLRDAAPRLAALLADGHPARDITRNLFRLARLAGRPADEPVPRTEIDMAEQWWRCADGAHDGDHRERARLLKALAEQALLRAEPLDVSDRPARAINALVTSETLRDFGGDRVAFRHDVLREWAIANLLFSEPAAVDHLPFDRPASAALARGVELTARMALERASDGTRWQSLVETLSRQNAHGSWRRAALLALVRSEVGSELLKRASSLLFANRGSLLRELIRTVMAVDVEPASKIFTAVGVDAAAVPPSIHVPSGPSWHRLIGWLLNQEEHLPAAAIPDVVDLYSAWPFGMLGLDPLTPVLLRQLYHWLTKIETARDSDNYRDRYHRTDPLPMAIGARCDLLFGKIPVARRQDASRKGASKHCRWQTFVDGRERGSRSTETVRHSWIVTGGHLEKGTHVRRCSAILQQVDHPDECDGDRIKLEARSDSVNGVILGLQCLGEDTSRPSLLTGAQLGVAVPHRDHRRGDDGLLAHPVLIRAAVRWARRHALSPSRSSSRKFGRRAGWVVQREPKSGLHIGVCEPILGRFLQGFKVSTFGLRGHVLVSRRLRAVGKLDGYFLPVVRIGEVERVHDHESGVTQMRLLVGRAKSCGRAAQQVDERLPQLGWPEVGVLTDELFERAAARRTFFQAVQVGRTGRLLLKGFESEEIRIRDVFEYLTLAIDAQEFGASEERNRHFARLRPMR